jgi:hypothetical protein
MNGFTTELKIVFLFETKILMVINKKKKEGKEKTEESRARRRRRSRGRRKGHAPGRSHGSNL